MWGNGGAGAVLHRELLTNLRTIRAFGMLLLFVSITAIAVTMSWPGPNVPLTSAGDYAQASLRAITVILFALCSLFMPFIGAMAVAAEREQDTFELMRVTLISPKSIVLAKMVSAVGFFFMLLVAIAPIASAVYFLAGVETSTLLQVFALLVCWMTTVTALGICISAHSRRVVRSLVASLIATGALIFFGPVALTYVLSVGGALFGDIASLPELAAAGGIAGSPYITLIAIFENEISNGVYALALGYNLALASLFLFFAVSTIAKPETFTIPKPPRLIEDDEVLRARRLRFPFYLIDPLRRQPDIDETKNPIAVKELRWGLMQRGGLLIRIFYIALTLYLFIGSIVLTSFTSARYADDAVATWHLIQLLLVMAVGPAFVANSVTKEQEMGNADALNMTLLEPAAIVRGKVSAGIVGLLPLPLAAISANAIVYTFTNLPVGVFIMSALGQLIASFFSLGVGMYCSCLARRTTVALLSAYILTIVLLLFGPGLLLGWQSLQLNLTNAPGDFFSTGAYNGNQFFLSPLGLATAFYPGPQDNSSLTSILPGYAAALLVTLAYAALFLHAARSRYEKHHMRQA